MTLAAFRLDNSLISLHLVGFAMMTTMASVHATPPAIDIASESLYNGQVSVHPNILLNVSADKSVASFAYRDNSGRYSRTSRYIGYFDPASCYRYHNGNYSKTGSFFEVNSRADPVTHECSDRMFSGNFMNWASMSVIDVLRHALTGGDRIVDTPSASILQRALLPEDFYANEASFPRRVVSGGGQASAPHRITPFNVPTLYVVSCGNRILFSDVIADASPCEANASGKGQKTVPMDRKLGNYLVRVRVCDTSEGPSRAELCKQYGKYYKPVGEVQKYADSVRLAAMGYVLDDAASRYGGILRAPMKYVGSTQREFPGNAEVSNPKQEWNPVTGILYADPDGAGTSNSGVINYLNKFGRDGIYRTYDPVSELYYEAIRYLQGLQPTAHAASKAGVVTKENFPVIDKWVDPVIAACQRNHIVTIADANTHWDRFVPGNQRTTYNLGIAAHDPARPVEEAVAGKTPQFDVRYWTRKVGEMEADFSGHYANRSPRAKLAQLAQLDLLDTGADGRGTYYVAGLAYWANTNEIRLDKPVRVRNVVIDVDDGGNGLIDGTTRAIDPRDSQLYLAAKYGGFVDRNNDGNPFVTYADDGATVIKGSDTEWAGNSSMPDTYLLASQPVLLVQALRRIFSEISSASGVSPGGTASGTVVSPDGRYAYQAGFDSTKWSGSLKRFRIAVDDAEQVKISPAADWDAGVVLTGGRSKPAHPLPDDRQIYTLNTSGAAAGKTIEFKWNALPDTQRIFLDTSPVTGQWDGHGEQRVDYLRGVRNLESGRTHGRFRVRERVLGDIINSSPVFVGAPGRQARGNGYDEFYRRYADRTKAIYVGANDGMLHAFDADSGSELFAYVPAALTPELNRLTAPEYRHRAYVDGAIAVGEARLKDAWRTVLVAGMGGGAQGVFALDITSPANFSAGHGALWEFSDSDDPSMGNVVGTPLIAKLKTGKAGAEYRYFAIVSSGLNNYANDGNGRHDRGATSALFLLALDKEPSEQWRLGTNYYKFTVPLTDVTIPNGLGAPAVAIGTDGAVRYVYAGDLQGNLWRFDFTGARPWLKALGALPAKPLFVARDAENRRQPISAQPKVVLAAGRGYVVLFGTGKFFEAADAASAGFAPLSFYAVYDNTHADSSGIKRSQLLSRTLTSNGAANADAFNVMGEVMTFTTPGREYKGWYVDFAGSARTGERIVTTPLVMFGQVFFNTLLPPTDACSFASGRSYVLDVLSGMSKSGAVTGHVSTIGALGPPLLIEVDQAHKGIRNATGKRAVNRRYAVFNFGTGQRQGAAASAQAELGQVTMPAGRLSWREISNWQELRKAAQKQ